MVSVYFERFWFKWQRNVTLTFVESFRIMVSFLSYKAELGIKSKIISA